MGKKHYVIRRKQNSGSGRTLRSEQMFSGHIHVQPEKPALPAPCPEVHTFKRGVYVCYRCGAASNTLHKPQISKRCVKENHSLCTKLDCICSCHVEA